MKLNRIFYLLIVLSVFISSCKNDDSTPEVEVVPLRLLSEVAAEDDAELLAYLKTHFYNYDEFDSPSASFDYKIKIDTIAGDNAAKRSLYDDPMFVSETISIASSDFGRDDNEVVDHKLYYIVINEGIGDNPTYADSAILRYEGSYLSGDVFDFTSNSPVSFYLPGTVRGYRSAIVNFKTGAEPVENGDGTVSFSDYGIGLIFIPSGLAYFDDPRNQVSIPDYTPIMFKIDVLSYVPDTDFDDDGIPSIIEDLNENGLLYDDDTDEDGGANHLDADDDNDGVSTRDEISDSNGNIIIPYPDDNNDGTPNYLDSEVK